PKADSPPCPPPSQPPVSATLRLAENPHLTLRHRQRLGHARAEKRIVGIPAHDERRHPTSPSSTRPRRPTPNKLTRQVSFFEITESCAPHRRRHRPCPPPRPAARPQAGSPPRPRPPQPPVPATLRLAENPHLA